MQVPLHRVLLGWRWRPERYKELGDLKVTILHRQNWKKLLVKQFALGLGDRGQMAKNIPNIGEVLCSIPHVMWSSDLHR